MAEKAKNIKQEVFDNMLYKLLDFREYLICMIFKGNVENNIFSQINSFQLGDVVQSMNIIDEKAYIVVNNSSKIEVANIDSMNSIATIQGLISPRYIPNANAVLTRESSISTFL